MAEIDLDLALRSLDIDENIEIEHSVFTEEEVFSEVVSEDEIDIDFTVIEIPQIPKLVFINEENISQLVVPEVEPTTKKKKNSSTIVKPKISCTICNKKYTKEENLEIHVKKCKKKQETSKVTQALGDKDKFLAESVDYFKRSIEASKNDPMHDICGPGLEVKRISEELLEKFILTPNLFDQLNEIISKEIHHIINFTGTKSHHKEIMLKKFLKLCYSKKLAEKWEQFLVSISISFKVKAKYILLQYIFDQFLCFGLSYRTKILKSYSKKQVEQNVELDSEEEETIRYVCGYIIFLLKSNIKDKRTIEGKALVDLLSIWGSKTDAKSECSNLNEYASEWVDRINRGGLILVTDLWYMFIREIESQARKKINKDLLVTYCGENLSSVVFEKLKCNKQVIEKWELLTIDIDNESLLNVLFDKIIKKWIHIRIRAFIKAITQIMRRKNTDKQSEKPARKGEVSLRKSLK